MGYTDNLAQFDSFLRDELIPSRAGGKDHYVCPLCNSGARPGGTGALSVHTDSGDGRIRFTCFSCGKSGDIFELFAQRDGLSLSDATRAVIAKYGHLVHRSGYSQPVSVSKPKATCTADIFPKTEQERTASFASAIIGSDGHAYLRQRGISDESIARFRLGYDAAARRIVIPHNRDGSFYVARSIDPNPSVKYMNPKGVQTTLFNADALYSDAPCFIVESDLCAISIEQEGGNAVALAGLAGVNKLNELVVTNPPTCPALIVSLDNDAPGREIAAKLFADLQKRGFLVLQANISGACKDPNELLTSDPAALRTNVAAAVQKAEEAVAAKERLKKVHEEAKKDAEKTAYASKSASGLMGAFVEGIHSSASTPAIPTGFPDLDRRLDGGLYEGLYILGAISSLGKTTFVHQMADQIAQGGHDVLYFSLEMASFELIAKSISRLTHAISRAKNGTASLAKTTRGILAGKKWERYSDEELSVIEAATEQYGKDCAPRIWIEQGIGDIGVDAIRRRVEEHVRVTGSRPVVVIDYVQILAPSDPRASDKQNTDKNVLELKRLSRDQKIPIICISSLNRDNYSAPISMAAFKESGSLEYGSDVLIGLQHDGMDFEEGENDKAREKRIREMRRANDEKAAKGEPVSVELKILKNRNGVKGDPIPYLFTARYNYFVEASGQFIPAAGATTPWDKAKKRTVL